jgi:DNA-binding response OmpR family regulator
MQLLLVEDDDIVTQVVIEGLSAAGFTVDCVRNLENASTALAAAHFDAVMLDLGLPDGDGGEWLKIRRAAGETVPVLIVTARASTDDTVNGLNLGADDFLAKPFDMTELEARLKALLRRPSSMLALTLELGNVRFDTVSRELRVGGRVVVLSRSKLTLLELLLRRAGRIVARRMLEDGLYGFDDHVGPNSLEARVSRLRNKLKAADATVQIHTVRGVGYLADERTA